MKCIFRGLSRKIGDDKRRLSFEKSLGPAFLKIPVVQACLEDLILGVRNNAVGFIPSLRSCCIVAVDESRICRRELIYSKDDIIYELVASLACFVALFPGILYTRLLAVY